MTKKKMAAKAITKFAYVGPTLPGIVKEGTVYENGSNGTLMQACKKMPALTDMIVTVDALPEALRELKIPDSALTVKYNYIKKNWR